jgi:hypothetical protein
MSADPRFDVRGPDEFEEPDWAPRCSTSKGGRNSPNYPVIAAGVCPACGSYPPCKPNPYGTGYLCQAAWMLRLQAQVNRMLCNQLAIEIGFKRAET